MTNKSNWLYIFLLTFMFVACLKPEDKNELIQQIKENSGVLDIEIHLAKIDNLELDMVYIKIYAEGQKKIMDTLSISDPKVLEIYRSYRGLLTEVEWQLDIEIVTLEGNVFYEKSFTFQTSLGEDAQILINLDEVQKLSSEFMSSSSISNWCSISGQCGTFTDTRDKNQYEWTKIGKQIWMAENLNFDSGEGSFCLSDSTVACKKYGRLYTWDAAMNGEISSLKKPSEVKGVCPNGWHLPSDKEWQELAAFVSLNADKEHVTRSPWLDIGKLLKSMNGWKYFSKEIIGNGTNEFGFNALPSSSYNSYDDKFENDNGGHGYWWTSTAHFGDGKISYSLFNQDNDLKRLSSNKANGHSLRCVNDLTPNDPVSNLSSSSSTTLSSSTSFPLDTSSFVDSRDGTVYKTTRIGTQNWMAENLNYENGLGLMSCPAASEKNCPIYGRLYSFKQAIDSDSPAGLTGNGPQGICPNGWHLPSSGEWETLAIQIAELTGDSLKEGDHWSQITKHLKAKELWETSNAMGEDTFGFRALPAGNGTTKGEWTPPGPSTTFWTSSQTAFDKAYVRQFNYKDFKLSNYNASLQNLNSKGNNFNLRSIRCLENEF